jgi:ferritin-like protein
MPTAPHYLRQFFAYEHLRGDLQEISRRFADLAAELDELLPDNPEKTAALGRLLEAKDCAVRAKLFQADGP